MGVVIDGGRHYPDLVDAQSGGDGVEGEEVHWNAMSCGRFEGVLVVGLQGVVRVVSDLAGDRVASHGHILVSLEQRACCGLVHVYVVLA